MLSRFGEFSDVIERLRGITVNENGQAVIRSCPHNGFDHFAAIRHGNEFTYAVQAFIDDFRLHPRAHIDVRAERDRAKAEKRSLYANSAAWNSASRFATSHRRRGRRTSSCPEQPSRA